VALLGQAVLAMWWDVAAADRAELAHWHAHEHLPERLGLPGFRRASRWTDADGGDGLCVLYELDDHAVLSSPAYVARLNAPTPWSARMMPLHRGMVRSQCRVLASQGALTARHLLTLRLAAQPGRAGALQQALGGLAATLVQQPGIVGLHLLQHQAPAMAATTEQQIRGLADQAADLALLVAGYDADTLRRLGEAGPAVLGDTALQALGAAAGSQRGLYSLAYAAVPADMH